MDFVVIRNVSFLNRIVYRKEGMVEYIKHDLKILPEYFKDLKPGIKRFEIRKDDRDYKVGDIFALREWSPETGYTGKVFVNIIRYVLRNCPEYGLMDGYCIFCW